MRKPDAESVVITLRKALYRQSHPYTCIRNQRMCFSWGVAWGNDSGW